MDIPKRVLFETLGALRNVLFGQAKESIVWDFGSSKESIVWDFGSSKECIVWVFQGEYCLGL